MPIAFVDPTPPVSGLQNGSNLAFTLANAPNPTTSLQVFLNGVLQEQGVDYTLSGTTYTYASYAPISTDIQLTAYRYISGLTPSFPGAVANSTILAAALRKAGVTLAPGRPPAPEQMTEALNEEIRMVASWNLNQLLIFTENRAVYTTIANQQTNTIGITPTGSPVADLNGPRPWAINGADLLLSPATATPPSISQQQINSVRRPLAIWNRQDWQRHKYQAVYTYPQGLYYDKNYDPVNGFGTIYWWPIPDQAYWVELFVWQQIQQFQTTSDVVMLPDGYQDAIVNNLAVRLDQFPWTVKQPMSPTVVVEAQRGLALIEQMNIRVPRLYADKSLLSPAGGGVYWPTGTEYDAM